MKFMKTFSPAKLREGAGGKKKFSACRSTRRRRIGTRHYLRGLVVYLAVFRDVVFASISETHLMSARNAIQKTIAIHQKLSDHTAELYSAYRELFEYTAELYYENEKLRQRPLDTNPLRDERETLKMKSPRESFKPSVTSAKKHKQPPPRTYDELKATYDELKATYDQLQTEHHKLKTVSEHSYLQLADQNGDGGYLQPQTVMRNAERRDSGYSGYFSMGEDSEIYCAVSPTLRALPLVPPPPIPVGPNAISVSDISTNPITVTLPPYRKRDRFYQGAQKAADKRALHCLAGILGAGFVACTLLLVFLLIVRRRTLARQQGQSVTAGID